MYSRTKVILHVFAIIFGLAWVMIECSCEGDTDKESSQANLSYSIKLDKTLANYPEPKKLRYCFYPTNGGPMLRTDGDANNFKITLPADKYNILVFNCDAANIEFKNLESFDEAEARLITAKATKATDNNINPGTPLYGLVIHDLEIEPGQNIQEVIQPAPLVKEISFNINIDGSEYISKCNGSLSGVAAALNLSKQQVMPDKPAIVNIETTLTDKGIKGSALILGIATQTEEGGQEQPTFSTNQLTLNFTLTDGSTFTTTTDLGHDLSDKQQPDIHVDMDATISLAPTFTVTINSWKIASGDSMIIK
ncbi:DUF5119 domain-containing protein [Parabacteroides bouchesdurhonensis]|uniref:DUF5119 domain-containing protein n=1 Tax=Parabacteroides bouchesdurhonensis TaxID=1936995 RepID=UPI000C814B41|nr:DUF5119 domain-containing protein [Parabacteroides bouchesdurhonensis]